MGFNKDTEFFFMIALCVWDFVDTKYQKKSEFEGLFEFQTPEVCCIVWANPPHLSLYPLKRCHFSFHADHYRGQASVTAN